MEAVAGMALSLDASLEAERVTRARALHYENAEGKFHVSLDLIHQFISLFSHILAFSTPSLTLYIFHSLTLMLLM